MLKFIFIKTKGRKPRYNTTESSFFFTSRCVLILLFSVKFCCVSVGKMVIMSLFGRRSWLDCWIITTSFIFIQLIVNIRKGKVYTQKNGQNCQIRSKWNNHNIENIFLFSHENIEICSCNKTPFDTSVKICFVRRRLCTVHRK